MNKTSNHGIEPSEKQKSVINEFFELVDKLDDAKQKELLAFVKGVVFSETNISKSKAS